MSPLLKKKCEGLCYFVSSPAPQGQIGEKEIKREPILPEKGFLKARINSNIWAFGSIIQERYMQVTSSRKHFLHSYKFMCVLSLILQRWVRSLFLWATITNDHFDELWAMITHDHFSKILWSAITIMICDHFPDHF